MITFKRKIYQQLLKWKEGNGASALLIEGARRIGKSTIVEEFAKREYKSYILVDLNNMTKEVEHLVRNHLGDIDMFLMLLAAAYQVDLHERNSLIIFDEVQKIPTIREKMKYFVADGRYDYIETGSLISIRENVKDITIPSEEDSIKMYPMDFEEYMWAMGEGKTLDTIRYFYDKREPIPQAFHNKFMLLFRQYMIVGGMPKPLAVYLESNRNFGAVDLEKRRILKLYRNDIMKIDKLYRAKVLGIYDQIPGLLSKHEKRVMLNGIVEGSRYEAYEDTFFWLEDSMIANMCFSCNDPNVGLSIAEDRTSVKCYMGDTGLLISHAFSENQIKKDDLYTQLLLGKLSLNEGMLFENMVAQMLVSQGNKLFFYTHYNAEMKRNDIEIDFLVTNPSRAIFKVTPIEAKSTRTYSTVSLERFAKRFHERVGGQIVIHTKNLKEENGVLYLPAYMTFCLPKE